MQKLAQMQICSKNNYDESFTVKIKIQEVYFVSWNYIQLLLQAINELKPQHMKLVTNIKSQIEEMMHIEIKQFIQNHKKLKAKNASYLRNLLSIVDKLNGQCDESEVFELLVHGLEFSLLAILHRNSRILLINQIF